MSTVIAMRHQSCESEGKWFQVSSSQVSRRMSLDMKVNCFLAVIVISLNLSPLFIYSIHCYLLLLLG